MAEDTHANQTTAFRYDGALAQDIEARRQQRWEEENVHHVPNPGEPGFDPNQKKFYCLDMFPYPSGKGSMSDTRWVTSAPTSSVDSGE